MKEIDAVSRQTDAIRMDEASLSRVYSHTQGTNIGVITSNLVELSPAEKKSRNAELYHDIRSAGFGVIKIKCYYVEDYGTPSAKDVEEDSYLVIGNKGDDRGAMKGFLRKHGKKFGQDCVLYKPWHSDDAFVIGTKKDAWPGEGNTEWVGKWHPNRTGQFLSMLKNGRTITFGPIRFLNLRSFFSRTETDF